LDILQRSAVNDRARHTVDRLRPYRGCSGVLVIARPRNAAWKLATQGTQCAFDQFGHRPISISLSAAISRSQAGCALAKRIRADVKERDTSNAGDNARLLFEPI
jgi:hypothetical protein